MLQLHSSNNATEDAITDNIETDASESYLIPQAEEIETGGEQASDIEEPQATEETALEVNTPLPTTPVRCSSSRGLHPVQHDPEQSTTPIRTIVTAEGRRKRRQLSERKIKLSLKNPNEKKYRVKFEQETDLRRSSRINGAKRTEKLGGVEYFEFS